MGINQNNFQARVSATTSLANFARLRSLSATPKLKRRGPLKDLGHDLNRHLGHERFTEVDVVQL